MTIYVDNDAMPRQLKEVLFKVAQRECVKTIFVAAFAQNIPYSEYLVSVAAGTAFNGADDWIAEHVSAGDLVVTADIPLADRAITAGAEVLNTKGEFFTPANIKNALAMRELMEELRITGEVTGGPPPFSDRQRIDFTNALNRYLTKKKKIELTAHRKNSL